MGVFRRVKDEQAGPAALGILTPPGRRTVLILRPRALPWDLLLLRVAGGTAFRELSREEASHGAEAVYRALEQWSAGGAGTIAPVPHAEDGFLVRALIGNYPFLACSRVPGQAYQPLVCADADAAGQVARTLLAVLRPGPAMEQELYCNARHFSQ